MARGVPSVRKKDADARAYDLLKSIMATAIEDELIEKNPCTVKGGSLTSKGKKVIPPNDAQYAIIIENIDPRYVALVVLAASGGLRWGEATALYVKDIELVRNEDGEVRLARVRIERQVVYTTEDGRQVGTVKALASERTLSIFGDEAQIIAKQIEGKKLNDLLFSDSTGKSWLPQTSFFRHWKKARAVANRPDMPFHALRHYAGTRYAQSGATTKETMDRLGHSSMKEAMRYQHSSNRDEELAERMALRKKPGEL